jgi:hypothetical protein
MRAGAEAIRQEAIPKRLHISNLPQINRLDHFLNPLSS